MAMVFAVDDEVTAPAGSRGRRRGALPHRAPEVRAAAASLSRRDGADGATAAAPRAGADRRQPAPGRPPARRESQHAAQAVPRAGPGALGRSRRATAGGELPTPLPRRAATLSQSVTVGLSGRACGGRLTRPSVRPGPLTRAVPGGDCRATTQDLGVVTGSGRSLVQHLHKPRTVHEQEAVLLD